jgi:2-polyprenyl-6-methoxyphenol hydroxylase-like FAD-dependent oxidoreductase
VIVAGAGPVGLWLASELRLAGVSVTVFEPRSEPDPHSKALTVHPRTIEILAGRGVEEPFLADALRIPDRHFGVLDRRLDFAALDTPFRFTLSLLQARTEALLEAVARDRGAVIRRGHRVTGLAQRPDAVTVDIEGPEGPYSAEAEYVVGCDGVRGTVRAAVGIPYEGENHTVLGFLGDVVLDDPPEHKVFSKAGPDGLIMAVPLPGGLHRIVGSVPDDVRTDWPRRTDAGPATGRHRRRRRYGFGMHSPVSVRRGRRERNGPIPRQVLARLLQPHQGGAGPAPEVIPARIAHPDPGEVDDE